MRVSLWGSLDNASTDPRTALACVANWRPAMRSLPLLAGMVAMLSSQPACAQAGNSHLVSPDKLSQISEHAWVIQGFPNIGIVVGKRATLVIDTGLGTRNGQIVSEAAVRLSPQGKKL